MVDVLSVGRHRRVALPVLVDDIEGREPIGGGAEVGDEALVGAEGVAPPTAQHGHDGTHRRVGHLAARGEHGRRVVLVEVVAEFLDHEAVLGWKWKVSYFE